VKFGQCNETFTEGKEYWDIIPEIRVKWTEGLSEVEVKAVMVSLSKLGYS